MQLKKNTAGGEGRSHCGGCYRGIIVGVGEGSFKVEVELR
jgi:hypothetical protein